jgi:uncharacterized Tic20 family protein
MATNEVPTAVSKDERNWAMFAHISGFAVFLVWGIGGILGPLIIWLVRKDDMPFAAEQAREALNFQITILIAGLICWPLFFIFIGFVLAFIVVVYDVIFMVIAAVKASEGVAYRYPISLRLIS